MTKSDLLKASSLFTPTALAVNIACLFLALHLQGKKLDALSARISVLESRPVLEFEVSTNVTPGVQAVFTVPR